LAAPDDHLIVSSSLDKTLRVWDIRGYYFVNFAGLHVFLLADLYFLFEFAENSKCIFFLENVIGIWEHSQTFSEVIQMASPTFLFGVKM
jgi:WD40 repeat protein